MNTSVTKAPAPAGTQLLQKSVLADMAERFGMEKAAFESTLMRTVMPSNGATNEQVAAFLVVAKHYDLNPFTKEIYAFPAKGGGVQPVVSIDGWLKIINSNPYYDGMEFEDHISEDSGQVTAITCRIYRKDRQRPIVVTEYMAECKRSTDPWRQWPIRMLRHKATIQAARYAFGFANIIDIDEYERIAATVVPLNTDVGNRRGSAALRAAIVHEHPGVMAEQESAAGAPAASEEGPQDGASSTEADQEAPAQSEQQAPTSPPPPPAPTSAPAGATTRRRAPPVGGGFGSAN